MLFIWRGFGWLIPIIVIVSLLLMQLSFNYFFGEETYENSEWPKVIAIFLSSILIAFLGYFFNYKKRVVVRDEKMEKTPSHTLFFIPIEFWAIILPLLSLWMANNNIEKNKKYMILIGSPAVNDNYHVDYAKMYNYSDKEFKYGVIKVTSVFSDRVEFLVGNSTYNSKHSVNKIIRDGKFNDANYFSDKVVGFTKKELRDFKKNNAIFAISRN
jgi:hypothetical protein